MNALALSRWAILAFFMLAAAHARAAALYGDVEFVEGAAEIVDVKGKSRAPRTGGKVFEGETLRTGGDGEMHVKTDDHGLVALRANTRIKVEVYRADGDAQDTSVVSLFAGTLRTITGWIGKYPPHRDSVKTLNATIGIRGTDHEPLYIAPEEKAPVAPGTYDKVNTGGTFIETPAGRIAIEKGHAGFAPHDSKAAPTILDKIPDVYRPTRNEERIRKRKEELEREVEKARLERQKAKASEKAKAVTGSKSDSGDKSDKGDPSTVDSSKAETLKEEAHKKAAERKRHRPESK